MSKRKRESQEKPESKVVRIVAIFDPEFREDLVWWARTKPEVFHRILNLVEAILQDPFVGIGKPEPLKYLGSDLWSRRITQEHRLVYKVMETRIYFLQARFHY
ncbi:MAG: Txe/YoeB family addiction module toxin [Symploca sp. SIO2D2]|nr:Txe/YoeB family addiction module toxin [Symploca sp. SIO2D2]NEQ68110.1 Txe/YoeB family addiction module toxin [Symploca sp. SIO2D2]